MQSATHYTSQVTGSNGTLIVLAKAGNKRVGTITRKHNGWEASFCGIRTLHTTKAAAFATLAK